MGHDSGCPLLAGVYGLPNLIYSCDQIIVLCVLADVGIFDWAELTNRVGINIFNHWLLKLKLHGVGMLDT